MHFGPPISPCAISVATSGVTTVAKYSLSSSRSSSWSSVYAMRTSGLHEAGRGGHAAVDDELGTGAVGRVIAREEGHDVRDLLGLTHALEAGHALADVLLAVFVHDRAGHRGVDAAGVHGV